LVISISGAAAVPARSEGREDDACAFRSDVAAGTGMFQSLQDAIGSDVPTPGDPG
jgi:hypothetical protein